MTGNVLLGKLSMEDNKAIQYRTRQTQGVSDKFSTLKNLEINLNDFRKNIEKSLPISMRKLNSLSNIPLVKQAEKTLKFTYLEAKVFKAPQIGTEHLLLCILKDNDNVVTKALSKSGVDYNSVKLELEKIENPRLVIKLLVIHLTTNI